MKKVNVDMNRQEQKNFYMKSKCLSMSFQLFFFTFLVENKFNSILIIKVIRITLKRKDKMILKLKCLLMGN